MSGLKVGKSRQKDLIDNWWDIINFCVDPLCCCGASNDSIFLAGIASIRLISADITVHIVHLVWPPAMVISGSYACLWSSAGRAEPHTSQHLVASRPCILYTFLSFPAVCRVLLNSFKLHSRWKTGWRGGDGCENFCKYSLVIHALTWSDSTLQPTRPLCLV